MKIRPENLLFPLPGTCEIRNSAVQWKKQFCRKGRAAGHLEPGRRVFFGRVVTGEHFVEGEERERLAASWAPLSADMETAAAAHVCCVNRVLPFSLSGR